MAWRVLTSGPMLEVSNGVIELPNGTKRESTTIQVAREGQLIKGDLSADLRRRYEEQDPYVLALVEFGEIVEETNEAGELVEVFVPKGVAGDVADEVDADAVQRAETAEGEVTKLRSQVTELQAQLEQAKVEAAQAATNHETVLGTTQESVAALTQQVEQEKQRADDAELVAAGALTYNDLSPEALRAEVEKKGLTVTRADGKDGEPLKSDLVAALEGARQGS